MSKRSVHFAFQGLLTAVLLLIYAFQFTTVADMSRGFFGLLAVLLLPLASIQMVSDEVFSSFWYQTGLFVFDAAAATYAVHWRQPAPAAYLVYFLIILSTAMTRNFKQSAAVGVVSCALFLLIGSRSSGWSSNASFWLRFQLLIITTVLLSVFSLDAQRVRAEEERRFKQRLVEAERLATLGRVAGEVAHRIKAPLTTIRVNAEVLSHKFAKTPEARRQLVEIEEEVERCKDILKSLLDLGRIEETDFAALDLRGPVKLAVQSLQTQAKSAGLRLTTSGLDKPLRVQGDHSLLQEAIGAVLQNAVEAGRRDGHIRLRVERQRPGLARIVIEDDGRGIADADMDRIFQPFYTTKEQGSGLGLSAALRIMQKHSGAIDVQSDGPGRGARFTLTLPALS